jgi:hypothetical protein
MVEDDKFGFGMLEVLILLEVKDFSFEIIGHSQSGELISLLDSETSIVFDNEGIVDFG